MGGGEFGLVVFFVMLVEWLDGWGIGGLEGGEGREVIPGRPGQIIANIFFCSSGKWLLLRWVVVVVV